MKPRNNPTPFTIALQKAVIIVCCLLLVYSITLLLFSAGHFRLAFLAPLLLGMGIVWLFKL